MKTIQTLTLWVNGQIKTAELLRVRSTNDDLESAADFYYDLLETDGAPEPYVVASGAVSISGTNYTTWKADTDTNEYAYNYVATELNLVITTP
jgi:hypothetical protein